MNKIELEIVAISQSFTQNHSYAVVLGETIGKRRLPIVIGGSEAQAIAVAMENMNPSRPLTHDLIKSIFDNFDIVLKEVVINNLLDGVFFAKLICLKDRQEFEIDSRSSDAIALAVRFGCPIYTYETILDSAGIILEETAETSNKPFVVQEETKKAKTDYSIYTLKELNKLLSDSLENEDYEKAASVRDEISKRGK
ncbi:MAG: bifunctional nuclease family protein [Bacteroidetes bacterium]|jgi:bifunctional DNase/RNase|nr:bifunctional nuclease family protein [Bacteroidota bacterium]MBP7257199.1 bifunctional nuclease family protein [Chitinophagales bacterium]MBK8674447.1 bifunctional nuclease family protein [Bacteroidota bacterium]MBK9355067.1 bifunctional nuclease family protein [Bacteroidota bacterium]MBK9635184.1 bifunctional nuclease family protein [Bacteroidota bacterium]